MWLCATVQVQHTQEIKNECCVLRYKSFYFFATKGVIFTWKQSKEWVSLSFSVVDFIKMVDWVSQVLLPTILVRSAPQLRPFSLFPCKITTSQSVCYLWNAHLTKMFTLLHSVPVHCMLSNYDSGTYCCVLSSQKKAPIWTFWSLFWKRTVNSFRPSGIPHLLLHL